MPARAFGRRVRSAAGSPSPDQPRSRHRGWPAGHHAATSGHPGPFPRQASCTEPPLRTVPLQRSWPGIHPAIIKSLDDVEESRESHDNETLATQLPRPFSESGEADAADLSPIDRQKVVTQLVHDIKGLGPIEPLLQDEGHLGHPHQLHELHLRGTTRPARAGGHPLPRRPAPGAQSRNASPGASGGASTSRAPWSMPASPTDRGSTSSSRRSPSTGRRSPSGAS